MKARWIVVDSGKASAWITQRFQVLSYTTRGSKMLRAEYPKNEAKEVCLSFTPSVLRITLTPSALVTSVNCVWPTAPCVSGGRVQHVAMSSPANCAWNAGGANAAFTVGATVGRDVLPAIAAS